MKYAINTLGCKVNAYESEIVDNILKEKGYEKVSFNSVADIYIINSCTVTNKADAKSRQVINKTKKLNKDSITIVMGCMVQVNKDKPIKLENVEIVIGNNNKTEIVNYIEEYLKTKKKVTKVLNLDDSVFEDMVSIKSNKTRAIVKIQDGCNNFCSYCIIPYARGPLRSKKINIVVDEVKELVKNSHKEVVLTGIHTGNYGSDINTKLVTLLKELEKIQGLERIRISSVEITELDEEFINHLKTSKKIVPHLHIPLQSGSDEILKQMNRKYNMKYFMDKIKILRDAKENMLITTDLIVGFPGETQELFDQTKKSLESIKFHNIHVFPYSIRENTVAASMDGQISEIDKKMRVKEIMTINNKININSTNSYINKELEVLFETKVNDTEYIGHSDNYLLVKVKTDVNLINTIKRVKIKRFEKPYLVGELLDE